MLILHRNSTIVGSGFYGTIPASLADMKMLRAL